MTGRATKFDFRGSPRIVSGLAENTNSIFGDGFWSSRPQMDVRFCKECRNHQPSSESAQRRILIIPVRALQSAPSGLAFSLDNRLTWMPVTQPGHRFCASL